MKKSSLLFGFSAALLLTAIGLVVYGETQVPAPRFTSTLKELVPPPPQGWEMKEKPIADTPEMQQAVGELLNFSDGIFVDYTNAAGDRLSIYIAYWVPGKMSHRLVAGHTPDVCWVGNGWKKTESTRLDSLTMPQVSDLTSQPSVPLTQASAIGPHPVKIPPGEARTFEANGTPEHVWFWHIVGNESKSYATGAQPPWHAAITDLFAKGLNQREEQFFIRLSSNRPLEQFMDGPVLPAVLKGLPWPETEI